MMNEKIDKLESRIFDLELSNDKLKQENDIMRNHISRQEDRMDGLEDGLNLCFQEKNDLEQYTRKSSIRITGLDDHDKDENIEESIKTVHKFLTKTVKMEIKESDINIALGALYSSFRKFWFVWVRSSFITYWVPFSIFLFLQASSLCFLDINRTITGLFCLGLNGPKRWAMLISDSFISILTVLVRNL
jgi:hypothetical protein